MRQKTRHKTGYVGGRGQSSSSRPSPDILRERQIPTVTGYISSKYLSLKDPRLLLSYPAWMRRIIWFNLLTVTLTPLFSLYGILSTPLNTMTLFFSVTYYIWNMIGVTAGYHRLWSHRSYTASGPLQLFLAIAGAGSVQGSIKWWSRHHRAHHRYTDTDLDPYNGHHGFWWTHIGWMLVTPSVRPGSVDISDLQRNSIVAWQHRWFFTLAFTFGLMLPVVIPVFFWNDWRGGLFYSGILRLTCVHHSVFCVNSLAHWLGEATFDDKLTPRDHFLTAIVTLGEGYHNFHHQFPMDYRNAIKWYQWDPTKWFIAVCSHLGLAHHLQRFPEVEIKKSRFTMQLKYLKQVQDGIPWPLVSHELPIVDWKNFQEKSQAQHLILVAGFIHDVGDFLQQHPGGPQLLLNYVGKDATAAFHGGIYDHSNAARNLLAMMRVGALEGGLECIDAASIPPCRRLQICEFTSQKQ